MNKQILLSLQSIVCTIFLPIIVLLTILTGDPHGISQLVKVVEDQE